MGFKLSDLNMISATTDWTKDALFGGDGGDGGRADDLRRAEERNLRLAQDRASINELFGITEEGTYSAPGLDPSSGGRDILAKRISDAELNPQFRNPTGQGYVSQWQQQLDALGDPETTGYMARAGENKAAREKMLGERRTGVMDYFNNEIERQRQLAEKNITLTMARRGRRGSALSGAMMDLTDENVRQQGRFSGRADDVIQGVRDRDTLAREKMIDALTGVAGTSADISGARSSMATSIDKTESAAKQYDMADLFSNINEIYGQRGAREAYNQGRQYSRNTGVRTDGGEGPQITPYG